VRAEVEELMQRVRSHFGRLDVLINNAGIIAVGPLETMTHQDFADALAVHFWGPLHAILAVLPEMRGRQEGRIVNIASIGGKVSVPHLIPYGASKFALVGLSEGLRTELAKDGILVTTVCPGLMRTGSPRHAAFKGQHRAEYAWFSVSDALPGLSMSAERAARQIIRALRRGDAEVVLSLPAKAVSLLHGVAPSLTSGLLTIADRLLPRAGGPAGKDAVKGEASESWVSPSRLTVLSERAAERYNQVS
jgi:NAD(P)-dependent dehydrogenase (short-subunit alcohol dehydrogenase family)